MPDRILVVEDDASAAEFVVSGLRQAGFAVERADNGPDGLHLAVSEKFDAIVLDRNLPGMDGLSVLKALRAAQNRTPLSILSAIAHADERFVIQLSFSCTADAPAFAVCARAAEVEDRQSLSRRDQRATQ